MAAQKPDLVCCLVDFYRGGKVLYKAGNVYPADDNLRLLVARGDAEAYAPPPAAKQAPSRGKAKAAAPEVLTTEQEATATNQEAPSADAAVDSDSSEPEEPTQQAQAATDDVAQADIGMQD